MVHWRRRSSTLAAIGLLSLGACVFERPRDPDCLLAGVVCDVAEGAADYGEDATTGDPATGSGSSGEDGSSSSDGGDESDSHDETGSSTGGAVEDTWCDTECGSTGEEPLQPLELPDGFPTPQVFGDSPLETDLIGIWTQPGGTEALGYSIVFEVDAEGLFAWREYDDACTRTQHGRGWVWVEGQQIVLLVGDWYGSAPWPVQSKYGWDPEPPFMVRAGYAAVIGQIGLSAPEDLRVAAPWNGRGYVRTVGGSTLTDVWVSETELWAIPPDGDVADIIVRDRYTLDIAGSAGSSTSKRWWFDHGQIDPEPAQTYGLGATDDGTGNATIAGQPHVYIGSVLATTNAADVLRKDGPSVCE